MALVFMFNVSLPELREKVYDGREGSQPQLASLQVHAQHSVQPTSGILRDLQACSWLRVYTALKPSPRSAHLRLTQAVSWL